MHDDVTIRVQGAADLPAVLDLTAAAFGGDIERELVRAIQASDRFVPDLSLVAEVDGAIVGHVMLSYVTLRDGDVDREVLTLSPLSVAPAHEGRGIGSALVRAAVAAADARGEPVVIVEGSPVFYGRFGFRDARDAQIAFTLPDWAPPEAGQYVALRAYDPAVRGAVIYPPAFPSP